MSDAATVDRARAAVDDHDWAAASALLTAADARQPLGAEDLERLAQCAFLTGRGEQAEDVWARAHRAFLDRGAVPEAVRCAFWLGLVLVVGVGTQARGGGWLARAHRLVGEHGLVDGVEQGYLRLPEALHELDQGDPVTAHAAFREAATIGERFDDASLTALGRLGQGQALLRMDEPVRGMAVLDEVLATLDAGGASPLATGIVYCGGILACQHALDLQRAQQWTSELGRWCDRQPDLVPFQGECLVHRAAMAQLRGDWNEASADIEWAVHRLSQPPDPAVGMAHYQRAELHRLRGERSAAATAYEQAAAHGHDPHPGLALLWLDEDRAEAAAAALRRLVAERPREPPSVVDEVRGPRPRAELLAAHARVMLAVDDHDAARAAAEELDAIAEELATPCAVALAAEARGAVLLAEGQPGAAHGLLAKARACWLTLPAPYDAARTRGLMARALTALGDDDTAAVELAAARTALERIGADPTVAGLADPATTPDAGSPLTPREREVIRLVAAGHTNRAIAQQLVISEKTVARHLHNVFTKLDLPNRSAATAYAYEHGLV